MDRGRFATRAVHAELAGGGMLSFEVYGGLPAARALCDRLEVVGILPSLGGVETGAVLLG